MNVTVLVHDAEEGGYWAEVPEFPGCLSQGETLDELERNIREAIEAWLVSEREDGHVIADGSVRRWDIPIPDAALVG
jgi:predicted RNase H-like HicB family nuclease